MDHEETAAKVDSVPRQSNERFAAIDAGSGLHLVDLNGFASFRLERTFVKNVEKVHFGTIARHKYSG